MDTSSCARPSWHGLTPCNCKGASAAGKKNRRNTSTKPGQFTGACARESRDGAECKKQAPADI
eukprot:5867514-Pleurochrysis_carterae.AAC.1